jgi:hypothetical protein
VQRAECAIRPWLTFEYVALVADWNERIWLLDVAVCTAASHDGLRESPLK